MKIRPIRIVGDIAYVPLTKGYEAIIDAADVPVVAGYVWHAREKRRKDGGVRSVHAGAKPDGSNYVHMHRLLCRADPALEVDHRDGNGLNNRRDNLRVATTSQNQMNAAVRSDNSTGVKGVYWDEPRKKFGAQIWARGKKLSIGRFETLEAAASAVASTRKELHGEFARPA